MEGVHNDIYINVHQLVSLLYKWFWEIVKTKHAGPIAYIRVQTLMTLGYCAICLYYRKLLWSKCKIQ